MEWEMSFKETSSAYLVTNFSLDWNSTVIFFEDNHVPHIPEAIRAVNYQSYFDLEGSGYLIK